MLKIVEFSKISIKLKNFKTFYKHKQRSAWKKLLNPPPGKGFLCLWNKNFWMEIYRNLQTFAFQVLRECSSWASRNGAVQILFLTPARNMFLAVLWEYIFNNVEWVRLLKWVRSLEQYCIVKWVIFFASSSWLWDFLPKNLKFVYKFQIWAF